MDQALCWELLAKELKKMANDVEEEAFEMKCTFEKKRKDPSRKNQNCKRRVEQNAERKAVRKRADLI